MTSKISIIIPCYNSEETLDETLVSVYKQHCDNWEAIIVNDGSPDNLEAIAQAWVKKDNRFKYYKKENGGLGSARNFGIAKSTGDYILPLDSDNMVRPDFANKALMAFDANPTIGVVYGDAMYFGEKTGKWIVGEFNKFRLLNSNYIDACAIIRKRIFDKVGGYDENMPYQGLEDWEFWLKVLQTDFEFYYLNKITFDYRVSSNSMIRSLKGDKKRLVVNYLKNKHSKMYISEYSKLFYELNYLKNRKNKLERLFLKFVKK